MSTTKRNNPLRHVRASDIRGVAKLAAHATHGVTKIVEGVHKSVLDTVSPLGRGIPHTGGITGMVYKSIYGVTQVVGKSIDAALKKLEPAFVAVEQQAPGSSQREAILAALNGVIGDRLAASHNPFATPMTLRYRGKVIDWASPQQLTGASGKIVLLIHGLCMNDLQWRAEIAAPKPDDGSEPVAATVVDHGAALAQHLGYTPIYVRYNTGLHTSQNGREFSAQIEQLVAHWPHDIEDLTIVVHSMGGLVTRSACHYGEEANLRWRKLLKKIVFLGTPHHGAPLERAGNWIDVILGSTPYSTPFAKLGQLRSSGITDLRYGHVLDDDWQGHDRFMRKPDSRRFLPLPEGVSCYTIAATTASKRSLLADRLIGDGLVPLHSALGHHENPDHCLRFDKSAQWIAYRMNHMELLSRAEVTEQILLWLTPAR